MKIKHKFTCTVLAVILFLTLLPISAHAADSDPTGFNWSDFAEFAADGASGSGMMTKADIKNFKFKNDAAKQDFIAKAENIVKTTTAHADIISMREAMLYLYAGDHNSDTGRYPLDRVFDYNFDFGSIILTDEQRSALGYGRKTDFTLEELKKANMTSDQLEQLTDNIWNLSVSVSLEACKEYANFYAYILARRAEIEFSPPTGDAFLPLSALAFLSVLLILKDKLRHTF